MQNVLVPGAVVLLTVVLWFAASRSRPCSAAPTPAAGSVKPGPIGAGARTVQSRHRCGGSSGGLDGSPNGAGPSGVAAAAAPAHGIRAGQRRCCARGGPVGTSFRSAVAHTLGQRRSGGGSCSGGNGAVPRSALPRPCSDGAAAAQCFADAIDRAPLTFVICADQQLSKQSEAEQLNPR